MENSGNQQQKNNWKKKGLGWIPDYPDLRDYNLGNEKSIKENLKFKIQEKTHNFEKILKNLTNLISDLNSGKDKQEKKQEKIEQINDQISDNVLFKKVKFNKILRYIDEDQDRDTINKRYPFNQIEYESIRSNQIAELKKYLVILLTKGWLKIKKDFVFYEPETNSYNTKKMVMWMNDKSYDRTTKLLVENFQKLTNIQADGIVGLETYTTFNETFCDENKLLPPKPEENREDTPIKSLSKIKSFVVISLIVRDGSKIILDILLSKIIEQIQIEYNNTHNLSSLFEHDFLEKIKVDENFFEKIFTSNMNSIETVIKKIGLFRT